MLTRRLLMAAGGRGAASMITLTTAPDGGWTQIPFPKAVEYNGKLYVGYVDGSNGNIELQQFDAVTGGHLATAVLHAALQQDTHAAPAVIVRSDGRIVAGYSAHNDVTHLYLWISTNPEDISAGTETNIDSQFGSDTYTYVNLVQLSGESNKLYLFVRSIGASTAYLQMSTSTDGGTTWAFHTDLYAHSGALSYWKIASNGVNRIDIIVTSDSGAPIGLGNLYHFYYDGTWRKSDGTSIGSPTFDYTSFTLVYNGATHPAWMTDLILDGTTPRVVYNISLSSNTDTSWAYAYYDGSWHNVTILASVGYGVVDPSPVAALDTVQPDRAFAVRYIGGQQTLWRYLTGDGGATWDTGTLVASGGGANIYPTAVKDHVAGHPGFAWLNGTYTADVNNSLGIRALPG